MEFSWLIFVSVMVTNVVCIGVMLLAQAMDKNLPARHSIIPKTNQKFLYIQDFQTAWYGDLLGVPLIVNAFVHLIVSDAVNLWWGLGIGLICAVIFLKMCLGKNHKPDQGFPKAGKISLNGILHLPYLAIGYGASAICLWNLFTGNLTGSVLWLALTGGAFYIGCFIADIRSGNFDSLKRVEGK